MEQPTPARGWWNEQHVIFPPFRLNRMGVMSNHWRILRLWLLITFWLISELPCFSYYFLFPDVKHTNRCTTVKQTNHRWKWRFKFHPFFSTASTLPLNRFLFKHSSPIHIQFWQHFENKRSSFINAHQMVWAERGEKERERNQAKWVWVWNCRYASILQNELRPALCN